LNFYAHLFLNLIGDAAIYKFYTLGSVVLQIDNPDRINCLDNIIGIGIMKDLVSYIAKALVDNPSHVKLTEISGDQTSVFELRVAKEDLGKIIGKQGRTVKAIRIILATASIKRGKRYVLEIVE
jgi:predicted RNA-binding protein YlqC (UPF0109 family)